MTRLRRKAQPFYVYRERSVQMSKGEKELQKKYGTKRRADAFYNNQMIDFLNPRMKGFIAARDLLFISTSDAAGNCDASLRSGEPGFVRVLDDRTIIYPEYRGNGVMASLGNILENPHIGLMFIDFTEDQTGLHINGAARIVENDALHTLGLTEADAQFIQKIERGRAERWVAVDVHEAYIHCSKHIPAMKKQTAGPIRKSPGKNRGDYFGVKK